MRAFTPANQLKGEVVTQPPEDVRTLLIAGSSGQAQDWSSTLSQVVRLSGVSTAGALLNFWANLRSTHAAAPSTGSTGTTAGSSDQQVAVQGTRTLQIPPGSTGFSVAALTSGYITIEQWRI